MGRFSCSHTHIQSIRRSFWFHHNLMTSHHVHLCYHSTGHHLPFPGLLQYPTILPVTLQSTLNKAARVMLLKHDSDHALPLLKGLQVVSHVPHSNGHRGLQSPVTFLPAPLSLLTWQKLLGHDRHFHLRGVALVSPLPKVPIRPVIPWLQPSPPLCLCSLVKLTFIPT